MDANAIDVVVIPVNCASKKAPCPNCGKRGKRVKTHNRLVRTLAYKKLAWLEITYGEYQARCRCCKTFCNMPEGVLPKAKARYDNKVRQAVIDRLLEDGMNIESILRALRRDFLLELSVGFVYDCLHDMVRRTELAAHRQMVLERFSGTLCVDEIHLGKYVLLLATDPLSDMPVAFALVSKNDQDHMRRFLKNLQTYGLQPRVVVTDDSPLYPKVLEELWPDAEHQLCVFHVLKNINKLVLDALRRLRNRLSRQGNKGRRKRRGRKSKVQKSRQQRRGPTAKDKAKFIFKHRFLIVKRRSELVAVEKKKLRQMRQYLPALGTLREFVDRVYGLFEFEQSEHQARCRRAALVNDRVYQAIPELAKVLEMLAPDQFTKMIAFLRSPAAKRVRTNNHVERTNRKIRFWEKVRYKWRRRRTIVRFIVLALDHWWKRICEMHGKKPAKRGQKTTRKAGKKTKQRKSQEEARKPHKNAA
jgi:transposase-like protein